ncbi:MAG: molybdenum cofactor guanylyltransferase [Caldisericaceae bacterium]
MNPKNNSYKDKLRSKKVKPVILVGGKSRRFGRDKFYLEFNGRLVIERTYSLLKRVFNEEPLFVGREALPPPFISIPDVTIGLGPIGGLYTALDCVDADFVFLTACDMPLINEDVLRYMFNNLNSNCQVYLPRFRNGMIEPLFAFYSVGLKYKVKRSIEARDFRMRSLLEGSLVEYLDESEIKSIDEELLSFLNINTKNDLDKIIGKLHCERNRDY